MTSMIEEEMNPNILTIAVAVLAAAWVAKDLLLATVRPVRPIGIWSRHRWLRLIRREDYVGAHRYSRYA